MKNNNVVNVEKNTNSKLSKVLNTIKKVCSWIFYAFLSILIIVTGWLCIDKYIVKSPIPSMFGYSSLLVATGSMSGTIEEGDLIFIKDTGDYKIGDIVTFFQEDDTIPTTHRIWNIDEDGKFITRGDANNSYDPKHITSDEIYGEVVLVVPAVGIAIDWLIDGGGYIYAVGVILIIGIGIYLLKNDELSEVEEVKEEEKTKE